MQLRKDIGVKITTIGATKYYTRRLLDGRQKRQVRLFMPVEVIGVTRDFGKSRGSLSYKRLKQKFRSVSDAYEYLQYYIPVDGKSS